MNEPDFPDDVSLKIGHREEYEKHIAFEKKLDELQEAMHELGIYQSDLEKLMEKYYDKSFALRKEYDKENLSSYHQQVLTQNK